MKKSSLSRVLAAMLSILTVSSFSGAVFAESGTDAAAVSAVSAEALGEAKVNIEGDAIIGYFDDSGKWIEFESGDIIPADIRYVYVYVTIDDLIDHWICINGLYPDMVIPDDDYWFYIGWDRTFDYSSEVNVSVYEKEWSENELARLARVYADEGINVFHFNQNKNKACIGYTVPYGGYFLDESAMVIRVDAAKYPNAGTLLINGEEVKCELNADNQWQIWAYEIPDNTEKVEIRFNKPQAEVSDKVDVGYEDSSGKWVNINSGDIVPPEAGPIYFYVDIDDYINHKLLVNGEELKLYQNGDGCYFMSTLDNIGGYKTLDVQLVEDEWSSDELGNYVTLDADEGISVYHYNEYLNSCTYWYDTPNGGYFNKEEAVVIRVDASKYPNADTLLINGEKVKCERNNDNQWQIWAYEIPDSSSTLSVKFTEEEEPSAVRYSIITNGKVSADKVKAAAGTSVNVKADFGYDVVVTDANGNRIARFSESGSFVMPGSNVYISAVKNDTYLYMSNAFNQSYIYSYDTDMNKLAVNATKKQGVITVDLGSDNAGKSFTLYSGRKNTSNKIKSGSLDKNGRYVFNVPDGKNYTLIVED